MSNYLVLHTDSSLIVNVVCSSKPPTDSNTLCFIRASEPVLDKYYKLASKKTRDGTRVSAGELAAISPAFLELLKR